jgi:hypothetical protein
METAEARDVLSETMVQLEARQREALETLLAASEGEGLCHRGAKPVALFLELREEGLRYACGHPQRHFSGYLDARK